MKILVFIPTLNENKNIKKLADKISSLKYKSDIFVVDDGSTDGTINSLKALKKKYKHFSFVVRKKRLGYGSAHVLGMCVAIFKKYDFLITMDSDFSHNPSDIERLVKKIDDNEGCDFVIGSRYCDGGRCDYVGYRKYISILGNILVRNLLRIPLKETTTSFRIFRVSKLREIDFRFMNNDGYSLLFETVYRLKNIQAKMREIPIHFRDRDHGESKIPKLQLVYGFIRAFEIFIRILFAPKIRKTEAKFHKPMLCPICLVNSMNKVFHKKYFFIFFHISDYKSSFLKCFNCGYYNNGE